MNISSINGQFATICGKELLAIFVHTGSWLVLKLDGWLPSICDNMWGEISKGRIFKMINNRKHWSNELYGNFYLLSTMKFSDPSVMPAETLSAPSARLIGWPFLTVFVKRTKPSERQVGQGCSASNCINILPMTRSELYTIHLTVAGTGMEDLSLQFKTIKIQRGESEWDHVWDPTWWDITVALLRDAASLKWGRWNQIEPKWVEGHAHYKGHLLGPSLRVIQRAILWEREVPV